MSSCGQPSVYTEDEWAALLVCGVDQYNQGHTVASGGCQALTFEHASRVSCSQLVVKFISLDQFIVLGVNEDVPGFEVTSEEASADASRRPHARRDARGPEDEDDSEGAEEEVDWLNIRGGKDQGQGPAMDMASDFHSSDFDNLTDVLESLFGDADPLEALLADLDAVDALVQPDAAGDGAAPAEAAHLPDAPAPAGEVEAADSEPEEGPTFERPANLADSITALFELKDPDETAALLQLVLQPRWTYALPGIAGDAPTVSYTHLTLPTIYSV